MIAAVCVEDRGGMLFNHRRVSRDRIQQEDLLELAGGQLWIAPFSSALFQDKPVTVDEDFLQKAGPGAVCCVEDRPLLPVLDRLEAVVVYRWNRHYPSDFRLDLDLSAFTMQEQKEFPGNSHETITREIYVRREES